MDRALTPQQHRAGRTALLAKCGLLAVLIAGAGWTGQRLLAPSVRRSDLLIEVVSRGPLEATVTATGTVVPRQQQTVASPVVAVSDGAAGGWLVRAILVSLGEQVERGKVIMQLDTTASELELHTIDQRIALSEATRRSQQLQLDDSIRQTRSQSDLRAIDLESRQAKLARLTPLVELGAVSAADLLEAQLDVKRLQVEVTHLNEDLQSLEARRRAELDRLEREAAILQAQRADQARRIELSAVKAPIITAITPKEGSVVAEGASLATIASQDSFSVEAAASEFYGPQLKTGQRVHVRTPAQELRGHLSRILPAEDASRLMLFIELDDPAARGLSANLRITADVVVAERPDVLQVRRGPGLEGSAGGQQLYVVNGNRAVRRPVRFGLAGPQQIEILAGAEAGSR